MRRRSVSEVAEELADQFSKGNRTHVRDAILGMRKKYAVGVALRVFDYLASRGGDYEQRSFIRKMTDNL